MSEQSVAPNLGRSTAWSVANNFLSQMLVLAVFLVTARFVPHEAFGVMAICFLVVDAFRQVIIESIGVTLTSRSHIDREEYNAAFLLVFFGSILAAVLIFMSAPYIAHLMANADIEKPLRIVCLLILAVGLSRVHEAWLMRHYMFKALAVRSIISICIGGGIGITLAVQGYGIWALVAQQISTAVIGVICLWLTSSWKPSLSIGKGKISGIVHDAKNIGVSRGLSFINLQSDIVFSSYYLGAAATGVFSAAKRIMSAIENILNAALTNVATPVFADAKKTDDKGRSSYLSAMRMSVLVTTPLLTGLALLSEEFVLILLGAGWLDTAPIVSVLAINAIISCCLMYDGPVMFVHGKSKWHAIYSIFSSLCNILLLFALSRYGILFVACAYLFRSVLFAPVSLGMVMNILKISLKDLSLTLYPPVLSSAAMASVLFVSMAAIGPLHPVLSLLVFVPMGAVVYGGMIFVLDRKSVFQLLAAIRK